MAVVVPDSRSTADDVIVPGYQCQSVDLDIKTSRPVKYAPSAHLGEDLWLCVCAFLTSSQSVAMLSCKLWRYLKWKVVHMRSVPPSAAIEALRSSRTRSVHVDCPALWQPGQSEPFTSLCQLPYLTSLWCLMAELPPPMPDITPLLLSRGLTSLDLQMWDSQVDSTGVNVLLDTVGHLSRLVGLRVTLRNNPIGPEGLANVHRLTGLTSLRRLQLDFSKTTLGAGVAYLGILSALTSLQDLHLGLSRNRVTDDGVVSLSALSTLPELTNLRLVLLGNSITARGVEALANFSQCVTLRTLHLNLTSNKIRNPATVALARLANLSALRRLRLRLAGNLITPDGAGDLCGLGTLGNLTELVHDFGANALGPAAGQLLRGLCGAFLPFRQLNTLQVDLQWNTIQTCGDISSATDEWCHSLPVLQRLVLGLRYNKLTGSAVTGLVSGICRMNTLYAVTLELSGNPLESDGAAGIGDAWGTGQAPITDLTMDLGSTQMASEGFTALMSGLSRMSMISSLGLWLTTNNITELGALDVWEDHPCLSSLSLDLRGNRIMGARRKTFERSTASISVTV